MKRSNTDRPTDTLAYRPTRLHTDQHACNRVTNRVAVAFELALQWGSVSKQTKINWSDNGKCTVCFFSTTTKDDVITQLNDLILTSSMNKLEEYCLVFIVGINRILQIYLKVFI